MKPTVSYNVEDTNISVALDKVIGDDNSYHDDLLQITVNGNTFALRLEEYGIVANLVSLIISDE
tara:strand:- start:2 stop:193 length:192 start_codon:yes stop_codon:yes gene_type:complete